MSKITSKRTTLLVCLLAGAVVLSCKGPEDEPVILGSSASSSSSSTVTPGVVNNNIGFRVEVDSSMADLITTYAHKSGLTTDCEITSVAAYSSVNCIVEVEELDLYLYGMKLAYNIPSNMCEYFAIFPFYFYKSKPGTGDTAVEIEVLGNGSASLITPGSHVATNTAVNTNSGTAVAAGVAPYANTTLTGAVPGCIYDYTTNTIAGPNCCEGTYSYTVHTQDATTGDWTSAAPTSVKWGGKHSNCLAGPAVDSATSTDRFGHPMTVASPVLSSGKADSYVIEAPADSSYVGNSYVANFLNGMFSAALRPTATNAAAAQPLGAGVRATQPFYLFQCLDRAREVKAQIRVAIREWNTYADFLAGASVGPNDLVATPDTIGNEAGSGEANNDFDDWDDIEASVGLSGTQFPEDYL